MKRFFVIFLVLGTVSSLFASDYETIILAREDSCFNQVKVIKLNLNKENSTALLKNRTHEFEVEVSNDILSGKQDGLFALTKSFMGGMAIHAAIINGRIVHAIEGKGSSEFCRGAIDQMLEVIELDEKFEFTHK